MEYQSLAEGRTKQFLDRINGLLDTARDVSARLGVSNSNELNITCRRENREYRLVLDDFNFKDDDIDSTVPHADRPVRSALIHMSEHFRLSIHLPKSLRTEIEDLLEGLLLPEPDDFRVSIIKCDAAPAPQFVEISVNGRVVYQYQANATPGYAPPPEILKRLNHIAEDLRYLAIAPNS